MRQLGEERHDASLSGFNITRRPSMTPKNPCSAGMPLLPCAHCAHGDLVVTGAFQSTIL